ncbi:MAG: NifU family protein [Phycisphaerales bacterium JB059]
MTDQSPPNPPEIEAQVSRIIEMIRPAIQADGGDVEFVGIDADGTVRIRLHGACVGCPSSSMTLKLGIERNLREHVPAVSGVQAVE